MIDITRPTMILMLNGVEVSRHRSEVEAMESASENGPGEYTLVRPDAKITVDGCDTPEPVEPDPVEPDPDPPVEPDPDPVDPVTPIEPPTSSQLPISYIGGARITQGTVGESRPAWTPGAISVTDDGMWMAGHDQHNSYGKFGLPSEWVDTYDRAQMVYMPNIVPFARVDIGSSLRMRVTGLYEDQDDRLMVNIAGYYDANGSNKKDMFVIENGVQSAPYKIQGGAHAIGWMGKTPDQWLDDVGPYYMGYASNIPINQRLSHGPSLFGWSGDPDSEELVLAKSTDGKTDLSVPTKRLMDFPLSDPMGQHNRTWPEPASPLWNVLSHVSIAFIHGDDYIAIGRTAGLRSGIGYKEIRDAEGNLIRKSKLDGWLTGEEDDSYAYYWKFKMRDILDAASPELPRPYEYGILDIPFVVHGGSYVDGILYLFDKKLQTVYKYQVI